MKEAHKQEEFLWWKHGTIYHIYTRSFFDSNGDGIGDIPGIIQKLDYISYLGVDAIWLSPVFASPDKDFGYDVSDYMHINPVFGTDDDFAELIKQSHSRNIHVVVDLVLNHTSDEHPWFIQSRSSEDNPHRDWYIWERGTQTGPPNNWRSVTGGRAWQYDRITKSYYLHSFFSWQPDLNWRNKDMSDTMFRIIKHWLDQGVDGFRLDAFNLIVKDKKLRNNPRLRGIPFLYEGLYVRNRPRSVRIGRELRTLTDQYDKRVLIAEIYAIPPGEPSTVSGYLAGSGKGIHLAFDFSIIFSTWNAEAYYKRLTSWYSHIPAEGWPCNVLSNHDLFRNFDRFPWRRHKKQKAIIAAFLLLTVWGTPFIYYGEEIGMHNGRIPGKALKDPMGKKFRPFFYGRDRARTPMQWDGSANAGFSCSEPWLPVNSGFEESNVKSCSADPKSILNICKNLISLRKERQSLASGGIVFLLNGKNGVLAYFRNSKDETTLIFLNFTNRNKKLDLTEHLSGEVLFSNTRDKGSVFYLQKTILEPYEASVFLVNS